METSARGRRKKLLPQAPTGAFRPSLPTDTFEVMQLFAIAARAVCAAPQILDDANGRLEALGVLLVAPESRAALECLKLWKLFAKVAQVPKASLRHEAARAFCRDLDSLGQRLDLPPLADWDDLPDGVDHANAYAPSLPEPPLDALPLHTVHARAKLLYAQPTPPHSAVAATQTASLLACMQSGERRHLFESAVGMGLLGRGDVNLLIRFLIKGAAVHTGDTTLIDVLERLGRYLAKQSA